MFAELLRILEKMADGLRRKKTFDLTNASIIYIAGFHFPDIINVARETSAKAPIIKTVS